MKYPRMLCFLSIFVFMGMGITGFCPINADADELAKSFEAFKPADDPGYHQRHTGGIHWDLFQEQPNEDTKTGSPDLTDIYWIQGEKGWLNRIMEAEGQSRLKYLSPANVEEEKYQSACPLCEKPTYFWLNSGLIDNETEKHIKADYPGWSKENGVCRRCFECYTVRSGKWYDGNLASTTDEYVIGYDKSKQVLDYFSHVK
jgi:hypothetical protein